ncbi:MAG: Ppx/GppA phosphatase [Ignavibacteria bacterium]|nr:MAG: Ppx/GppA phosphatase [Ignavibacteria bacterium]KAF0162075.1 MAG: Ppx/GppA phosphatase [Ignavibacteria bacterium]
MNVASIDLGSNSVILLIVKYDKDIQSIISFRDYYTTPRISENVSQTGIISSEAIFRLTKVLSDFYKIINENECESVLVNATNTFRIAENSSAVKKNLEDKFNWNISIITGEEEARLSYLGTVIPLYKNCTSLLIDIGGGSTEFIVGAGLKIHFSKSIQLGVVTLHEQFPMSLTSEESSIQKAEKFIISKLHELDFKIGNNLTALAVAGTPTTLSAIAHNVKSYSNELVDNTILELEKITAIRDRLLQLSYAEMRNEFGDVVAGREELIAGGSLILETIMKYFQIKKIIVSTKGLRYGAVYDYLIKHNLYEINS